MQLARGVEVKEVSEEVSSNTTQIEVPKATAIKEPSIVLLKGSINLPKFTDVK